MRLKPARVAEFRKALEQAERSAFGLVDVEVFPGATVYSLQSVIACRFTAAAEPLLKQAGEKAAQMIGARLGIEISSGLHAEAGDMIVLWVEYFPGGAHYRNARTALQGVLAAILALAADESGNLAIREAASREQARFAQAPVQDIYVQSAFLVAAARRANLPVEIVGGSNAAWQFGWGSRSDIFVMTGSMSDSVPGHQLTWRKHIAKALFAEIGLPTPPWRLLGRDDDALSAAQDIGWPCVVKPVDRAFGEGVTANIAGPEELRTAVATARRMSSKIIVEKHEAGADFRLMVVDGQLTAAVRRDPPEIVGDGKRTIEALIAALNQGRDGSRQAGYLLPVKRDAALDATLAKHGLAMSAVLPDGAPLALRSIANFSTGGSASDVTAQVHAQIRGLAELLARSIGLRTAGIDYITTDITRGHAEVGGGFIEVNAMPRLRLLMTDGVTAEAIGAKLLGTSAGRIPVTLIVGDGEALAELAEPLFERVAAVPGSGAVAAGRAQIGGTILPVVPADPFAAVATMLRHRAVDELVILWTPEDLARFGIPACPLHRMIVIGAHDQPMCVADLCRDIVGVADSRAALDAAFPGDPEHLSATPPASRMASDAPDGPGRSG